MSAGIQRNDTQQYITLEDVKPLTNSSYVPFSPTHSSDWWSSIKSEVDSSDSESSQQTILYSNGGDGGDDKSVTSSLNLNSPTTSEDFTVNKTKKKKGKDTPAVNKPAQVVARRNARERRRVQAVNWAFQRLRKVVPIEENKSKRMSKVKTLQLAIEYINQLQGLLQFTTQHTNEADLLADIFSDLQQQQQQAKLDQNDYAFRIPTTFYSHVIDENNEN